MTLLNLNPTSAGAWAPSSLWHPPTADAPARWALNKWLARSYRPVNTKPRRHRRGPPLKHPPSAQHRGFAGRPKRANFRRNSLIFFSCPRPKATAPGRPKAVGSVRYVSRDNPNSARVRLQTSRCPKPAIRIPFRDRPGGIARLSRCHSRGRRRGRRAETGRSERSGECSGLILRLCS